jgi:hypothetical protein
MIHPPLFIQPPVEEEDRAIFSPIIQGKKIEKIK